jgi:hypothetical protein
MKLEIFDLSSHAYCTLPNGFSLYGKSVSEVVDTLNDMFGKKGMCVEISEPNENITYNRD